MIFEGTTTYTSGTNVNLNPTADDGFDFSGWSGDTGSLAGNTVVVNGNLTITATFDEIIEEEPLPEVPIVEEEILDEVAPESAPGESIPDEVLPQTGGLPLGVMSLLGFGFVGAGYKIRKKKYLFI